MFLLFCYHLWWIKLYIYCSTDNQAINHIPLVYSTLFNIYYAQSDRGHYKLSAVVCLSVRQSVCRVPRHNSRRERHSCRKRKYGRMEAHHTCNSRTYLEVKRSRSPGRLMLTQLMLNIFRTGRPTKFKLGTQMEHENPHQRQARWPPRLKVKVARSLDASDRCWPIGRERNVLEAPKFVWRLYTPQAITRTSFKVKGQRSRSPGRLMLRPEVRHVGKAYDGLLCSADHTQRL